MTPEQLTQELGRKKIGPLYYFYGPENFLIEEAIKKIGGILTESRRFGFNLHIYYANENSPEEIMKTAQTLPIMSNMREVIVRYVDSFSNKQLEEFIPYLEDPVPSTCLIFVATNADTRKKFFQVFKKSGRIIQFRSLPENKLYAWIRKEVKKFSREIGNEAISYLIENGGGSLENLYHEIQKVVLYIGKKNLIEIEDLEDIIVDSSTRSIFDLIDYLGNKDSDNALNVLDKMIIGGQPPLLILTMIVRQFRLIWRAKEILNQGGTTGEIREGLNVPVFTIKQLTDQTDHFSFDELIRSFHYFLETDLALKSSKIDKKLILENLIINLCKTNGELVRNVSTIN